MKIRTAYCSARDRDVRVVVRGEMEDPPALEWPGSEDPLRPGPADLICLEYGESCTGDLCPLFEVPTEQMRENYLRVFGERQNGRR